MESMSKEKVEKILKELGQRKQLLNAKVQFSQDDNSARGSVIGNTQSCTDEVCGGGIGNVSACDDHVCPEPGADPDCMGNTNACGDWQC